MAYVRVLLLFSGMLYHSLESVDNYKRWNSLVNYHRPNYVLNGDSSNYDKSGIMSTNHYKISNKFTTHYKGGIKFTNHYERPNKFTKHYKRGIKFTNRNKRSNKVTNHYKRGIKFTNHNKRSNKFITHYKSGIKFTKHYKRSNKLFYYHNGRRYINNDVAVAAGIAEGLKKGSFFIDITKIKNWKPKSFKALAQSRKLNASASGPDVLKTIHNLEKNISNFHSVKYSATSGGYKGKVQSGYLSASGTAKAAIALTVNRTGAIVKWSLPSGKAHYRGFGATANLSGSAAAYYRNHTLNVGIYGPHASVDLGPARIGVGTGFGVEGVNNAKEKGGIINTGIGSFGVKVGCINKICLFGCISWKVCKRELP